MANLKTNYLGMELKNPLVVSPNPLCSSLDNIKRMEDAGAGMVVLHSLFEEQLTGESMALNANLLQGTESFAESLSYFPEMSDYHMGPDSYLDLIRKAKESTQIPIMGSLNGVSEGGWTEFAARMEEAGADGLELNMYYIPTDPDMDETHINDMYMSLVKQVTSSVRIPVAVKVAPHFTSMPHAAKRLGEEGAKGIVLFNRFYQPDIDLDTLEVVPRIQLSSPSRLHLRLRWTAILYGRVTPDIAITGGVHSHEDVVKCMMAGAKVSMMTSALLKFGIGHLAAVLKGFDRWLDDREYDSVEMMQGSMSQKSVANPAAFERANYMKVLTSYMPHV